MKDYITFLKRWGIETSDKQIYPKFQGAILISLRKNLKRLWKYSLDKEFCNKYCRHEYPELPDDLSSFIFYRVTNSVLYMILEDEENLFEFLYYLESLLKMLNDKSIEKKSISKRVLKINKFERAYLGIIKDIKIILGDLPINLKAKETKEGIIFYQSGDTLLDKLFVDDVIDWLAEFPDVRKSFLSSIDKYNRKIYERNLVDDARLSIELLLKTMLNNNRSLEKQKEEVQKYLKKEQVPAEIRSMFWKMLDYYTKYQNNYVKHDDKVNPKEVEFILYLTGLFIRFLLNFPKDSIIESSSINDNN